MIELSFDDDLYDGFALDEAVKAFEDFARIERERVGTRYLLRVSATPGDDGPDEATIAAELDNLALGKTIERRLRAEVPAAAERPAGGGSGDAPA